MNTYGNKILTTAEVAAMFGVSVKTVTKWVRTGKLRATRTTARRLQFLAADVAELTVTDFAVTGPSAAISGPGVVEMAATALAPQLADAS